MLHVAIIVGSTRPNRHARDVARWVEGIARQRTDATFEIVDIQSFDLPLLDEPMPPSMGQYANEHTKAWSARIDSFDGFVFVTPEYNHGTSGALKNAIDFVYREWNNKAAGFVSYGAVGGLRAVEQLRLTMAELQIADVRAQVALPFADDFENYREFTPRPHQEKLLGNLLDQVIAWSEALKPLRE